MPSFPDAMEELIEMIAEFPGIGRKSAERIMLYLARMDSTRRKKFSAAVACLENYVRPCKTCNNFSADEECDLCKNVKRNRKIICAIEDPKDILSIERTSVFNGVYHIIGSIAPLEGRGPESLDIQKLERRIKENGVEEVIIATDSDAEGEATALYLFNHLCRYPVKLSRLSMGMPVGVQLEYLDTTTLSKALTERKLFK